MTWVASILIVVGLYLAGDKNRWAFVVLATGGTLWATAASIRNQWDLAFICWAFAVMSLMAFRKWSSESPSG